MLTSIELFAGAGGLAMGLTQAGFHHRAVVEWNHHACETIRHNQALGCPGIAHWPVLEGDVRDMSWERGIDLVAGGPPCQPFSLGGRHRGNNDVRDMFPAFARVIRDVRPRAFIAENVKGLTRPGFAPYLDYILACLARPDHPLHAGEDWAQHRQRLTSEPIYDVTWRVLNAADHGVPQTRERVFIVGLRRDLGLRWAFPPPSHSRAALLHAQRATGAYWARHGMTSLFPARQKPGGLLPWRTVRDALAGLPDPAADPVAAALIPNHLHQPGVRFYPGHTGSPLDWPAKTLKAGDHGVPGGENALVMPDGNGRYFTVREAARLQTFPDTYIFPGSWGEAMRQLGNAVPVELARAIGDQMARVLLGRGITAI